MKFSETWLREWINPDLSSAELGAQLTLAGLELDGLESAAPEFTGVVVAEVQGLEPHPDADRLRVCAVNNGTETIQIVCGAANVRAGMKVPLATIGGELPGKDGKPFKIKKAKLRGVESFGMLCSAAEIGLAEQADGLLPLPADAPIGQDIREYLQLDDAVLEVDLTPNRADCLSVLGIARETAALNRLPTPNAQVDSVPSTQTATQAVQVQANTDCPRYVSRVISGVNGQAETPLWMQERLRRSGVRSLGPLVDVTNYVMLERGQPMHAFDRAKLHGDINVRRAEQGESLVLLDGQKIALTPDCLLIADDKAPLALAGVMGGAASGVSDKTTEIVLESAYFSPSCIAGRARQFGLHTDSAHRFERGVDPAGQLAAMERATALLLEIVGGEAGSTEVIEFVEHIPTAQPVSLSIERLNQSLGMVLPAAQVTEMLTAIGLAVETESAGWTVTAPSWRQDIRIEADLIEEIARLYGYDKLPVAEQWMPARIQPGQEIGWKLRAARRVMVDRGYHEAITYSFVSEQIQALLEPEQAAVALANPISQDMAVMRTSLWSGLLQTLQHNLNRQQRRLRLFESGLSFVPGVDGLQQRQVFAGLIFGSRYPEQWGHKEAPADFFDLKADVQALLASAGLTAGWQRAAHSALHPSRTASLHVGDSVVGIAGELHPRVMKKLGLNTPVQLFELYPQKLPNSAAVNFENIPQYPSVRRDISLLVNEDVSASQLCQIALEATPELLSEVFVFDEYRGDGVETGLKSIALGLILQDYSATLTDERSQQAVDAVTKMLQERSGAEIRA